MADRKVVTRFAPSPTGYLHIGGARTALFNWAFARRHGGTFLLRIEDTDRARSTAESTRRILEDLQWLGVDWDEGPTPGSPGSPGSSDAALGKGDGAATGEMGDRGPYFQSQRLELYCQHAQRLLEMGRAYKCFKTPQELAALRDAARQQKRAYKYDRTESINLSPETVQRYIDEGKPYVIRFRMPDTDITVCDEVLGEVTVKAAELEDFVIVKSDGYPTFHLANVVDDALMGVTHVLRAQEHLMNTPKHVALQDALGFDRPSYAHMPLIFNADGSKMSKRDKAKAAREGVRAYLKQHGDDLAGLADRADVKPDDAQAFMKKKSDDTTIALLLAMQVGVVLPEIDVHDFRQSGYLPQVILNYIALLGWSPGDDIERFDLDFLVKQFDLKRIGKSNARFDRAKLLAFNTDSIASLDPEDFQQRLKAHDAYFHGGTFLERLGPDRFALFAESYRPRCQTIEEPFVNGRFLITDDEALGHSPEAVGKVLAKNSGQGFGVLRQLRTLLDACGDWTVSGLESMLKGFGQQNNLGLGKVAQPLRVAVSGSTVSPPIYDTLVILGQRATLTRIDRCLRLAEAPVQARNY